MVFHERLLFLLLHAPLVWSTPTSSPILRTMSHLDILVSSYEHANASSSVIPALITGEALPRNLTSNSTSPGPVQPSAAVLSTSPHVADAVCTEGRRGQPYYPSCVNALQLLPTDEVLVRYYQRTQDVEPETNQIFTSPYRVLSSQWNAPSILVFARLKA